MTTPATTDDLLVLQLPESYRASRNVDEIKRAWQTILEREVGRHLEKIKQDVQDFTSAQTKMLNLLATYERDETAELILRRFAQDSLPGLLHLLPGISSGSQLQLPIRLGDDPEGMVDNDTDARSVTMGLEPIVTTRTPPVASMGPPGDSGSVRVARAPVAPMAPAVESESEAGPSSFQEGPNVYLPGDRLQIGKRPLNTAADDSRSSSSPSKKARTNGAGSRCLQVNTSRVWRTIQIWEVHGTDYIFQDDRCGPGYFVIRCNLSEQGQVGVNKPFKFTDAHPLESNEALDHFNNWDLPCHSSTKSYTLDDIIRGFAHRGRQIPFLSAFSSKCSNKYDEQS